MPYLAIASAASFPTVGRACLWFAGVIVSLSYVGSEMEEAAQNCLPSIQELTPRLACSSISAQRVLTIEQSCPSALIDKRS